MKDLGRERKRECVWSAVVCVLTGDDVEKAERIVLRAFLQLLPL